jgi:acyl dehydratase
MNKEAMACPLFDDFEVGDVFVAPWGRTISDADIKNFAGVSGDFQHLHMDDLYAKESDFGARIAHGPLTAVIALSLQVYFQVFRNAMGFLEERNKFVAPVYIGDTLRSTMTVVGKKPHRKPDRGDVFFKNSLKNQNGVEVLQAEYTMRMRRKPQ